MGYRGFFTSGSGGLVVIAVLMLVAIFGGVALVRPIDKPRPNPKLLLATAPSPQPSAHLVRREKSGPQFWIDTLAIGNEPLAFGGKAIPTIPAGALLMVDGWAVDLRAKKLASAVYVQVDGGTPLSAQYGIPRPDVARYFHQTSYENAGFHCNIPTATLSPGVHSLNLILVNSQKTAMYHLTSSVRFITQAGG